MKAAFQFSSRRGILRSMMLFFLLLVYSSGFAFSHPAEPGNYFFEFLTFKAFDKNKGFLEIFSEIPTHNLQFIKTQNGFSASYELSIEIFDEKEDHVMGLTHVDSVKVSTFQETLGYTRPHIVRFTFLLEPGNYEAFVRLMDNETLSTISFTKALHISDFAETSLQMSDIQVSSLILRSDENSPLVKNERKIFPNVSHIFDDQNDFMYVYCEFYNIDFGIDTHAFMVTLRVFDQNENEVKRKKNLINKPGETCALSLGISIADLASGNYKLVLDVEDPHSAQTVSKTANFFVVKPKTQYAGALSKSTEDSVF